MKAMDIPRDPYNLIITGVGGQGNVIASRMIGDMMVRAGYRVTIGETFGVSQRGGSVMSHMRISHTSVWSPQIPEGRADMIVALEPIEAIRVMSYYGNPNTVVLSNTRPIYPVGAIAGEMTYPSLDEIRACIERLARSVAFINATEEAVRLGVAILGNVIMMGAIAGTGILPLNIERFKEIIIKRLPASQHEVNITAFSRGIELITNTAWTHPSAR